MYLNMSSSNLSEDIKSTISRDPLLFLGNSSSFYLKPHEMNSTNQTRAYSKFHCFTRRSNYTSMNFEIKPEDLGIKLNVSDAIQQHTVFLMYLKNSYVYY